MTDLTHHFVAGGLWGFVIIAGPILLGAAIAWGVVTNRARTRQEREATERGTRTLYERIDREDKATDPHHADWNELMAKIDDKTQRPAGRMRSESYSGEEPRDTLDQPLPPLVRRSADNRGKPAASVEGAVVGSGAGAGGGGGPEDYDSDPQAGSGRLPTHNPKDGSGGDGAKHNSR